MREEIEEDSDLVEIDEITEQRERELQRCVIQILKALWCPANDGGPSEADLRGEVV